MKNFLLTIITLLIYTQGVKAVTDNQFVVTLSDGQKISVSLPNNAIPELPLTFPDATGKTTLKYDVNNITSIELVKPQAAIQGCHRWEVCKVATPSIILGLKNTEKRLLGLVSENANGKIYKWILSQHHGDNISETHYGLWYGILLSGSDVVYPFIQDSKVWFRDINMILGKSNSNFVQAVNDYYIKGKKKITDEHKEELKQHPASILDLLYHK